MEEEENACNDLETMTTHVIPCVCIHNPLEEDNGKKMNWVIKGTRWGQLLNKGSSIVGQKLRLNNKLTGNKS